MKGRLRTLSITIACVVVALPSAAGAAVPSSSAVRDDRQQRLDLAVRLIESINPDDRLLAQEMRAWEAGVRLMLGNDATLARLEQETPGVIDAAVNAGRPVAQEYLASLLSRLKRYKAERTAAALTVTELREVQAFYATPAGQRLATGMTAPQQSDVLIDRVAKRVQEEGDPTVTEQDARVATRKAVENVMAQATREDILTIMRFEATPAGSKLRAIGEEVQKFTVETSRTPDPAFVQRQQKAMQDAILAFVTSAQK